MISTRNDDDEPDVIDLTTTYGYYGSVSFPIRPPSPFAEGSIWSEMTYQCNEDNDTYGIVTWSSPTKQLTVHHNNDNTILSSSHSSSSSRASSSWRRTLNKLLKRTKLSNHKKVSSSATSEITQPYNFGTGEMIRTDLITSRQSGKRVHWIDDDETILNACHRFVEYLKLFIQNIINNDDINEDHYLKNCQVALNELNAIIDCQQIQEAFEYITELTKKRDKNQLLEQQTYIESLIAHTTLSSASSCS